MPGRPQFRRTIAFSFGLGRCRPDECTLLLHPEHALWPTPPAFPDGPEHPDERFPSFQARCHASTDTLLPATLGMPDPQLDRDRAVEPRADGWPTLRARGHSETAFDIGTDLPYFEHRCPRIPEMDCTDDPAPVADHVPARTGIRKCRMRRGNGSATGMATGGQKQCKDNQRLFRPAWSLGCCATTSDATRPFKPRSRPRGTVANRLATVPRTLLIRYRHDYEIGPGPILVVGIR